MYKHTDLKKVLWIEKLPSYVRPYLYLARYDRPVGVWLLFLPCLWSFFLAGSYSFRLLFLFFIGAFLMRGAGCIMNDLADASFDKRVERTKTRPLAAGTISKNGAFLFLGLHLGGALLILLHLNPLTIFAGISFLLLVILYPFMKRITYWPQLFLGITFNGGVLMVWTEVVGKLSPSVFLLYTAAVFWTLGYDTIYGFQDAEDDKTLGLKSTAILFEKKPKAFLFSCFSIMVLLLIGIGYWQRFFLLYYMMIAILYGWLGQKIIRLDFTHKKALLDLFKAQKWVGLWIGAAIFFAKL
jgi:4-hydroxybenzoate polyprenyl transferase